MLMLLCVHMNGILFLVLVGNSALTMGLLLELLGLTLVARSYALLCFIFSRLYCAGMKSV